MAVPDVDALKVLVVLGVPDPLIEPVPVVVGALVPRAVPPAVNEAVAVQELV